MRILFDGYRFIDPTPSGRNVASSTLAAWCERYPEDEITVALPADSSTPVPHVDDLPVARRHVPARVMNHQVWVRTALGRATPGMDLAITQWFLPGPLRHGIMTAAFIHDVLIRDHPEWFTRLERLYMLGARHTIRTATALITSSEAERERIIRWHPKAADRVHAAGLGLPAGIATATPEPVERPSAKPFILVVGRLNVRKNLDRLIQAFQSSTYLMSNFDLLIVGERFGRAADIRGNGVKSIEFLKGISDGQLQWLYSHAALFVFPSLGEGFGLPLLEARSYGARTVASDIPVFRELGFADAYFDPTDFASIRRTIEEALTIDAPAQLPGDPSHYTWTRVVETIREAVSSR